jgi:hypothetical protein
MSDVSTCCGALKINFELIQTDTGTIFATREYQTVKKIFHNATPNKHDKTLRQLRTDHQKPKTPVLDYRKQ